MSLVKACTTLQGCTALHTASATHHRGMPELLLSLGANPNVQDVEVCLLNGFVVLLQVGTFRACAMAHRFVTPIQASRHIYINSAACSHTEK